MHEMSIGFTEGFSHHVMWGWLIGVYLVLAGMSGGSLLIALTRRHYSDVKENTPLLKAASIVGFVAIVLGMVFLVADLHRPLYFWKILINYNWTSVMSIGVAAISIYIPLTALVLLMALEDEIKDILQHKIRIPIVSSLIPFVIDIIKKLRPFIEIVTLVFAIVICAYTGFLISVLVRFPLLNTAVLPILFVASGLAAGGASTKIVSRIFFEKDIHSADMNLLHRFEWPLMLTEGLLIFMLFVSLYTGNEFQKFAMQAFDMQSSMWAAYFWIGVVGIGFGVPLVLNFLFGSRVAHSGFTFYVSGIASVVGVLCLRIFLLYAGQTFAV